VKHQFIRLVIIAIVTVVGYYIIISVYSQDNQKTVNEVLIELDIQGVNELAKDVNNIEEIIIIGLKQEQLLEVWKKTKDGELTKLITYPWTATSGDLGPKLKQGDLQIPEGIYKIDFLHPNSSYHLSMRVNYPNVFDKKKAKTEGRTNLGGDIFIHGKNVTIGCIPIGDQAIEELFYLVGRVGKEKVKVIISPYDMRAKNQDLEIDSVTWEKELYTRIKQELSQYKIKLSK